MSRLGDELAQVGDAADRPGFLLGNGGGEPTLGRRPQLENGRHVAVTEGLKQPGDVELALPGRSPLDDESHSMACPLDDHIPDMQVGGEWAEHLDDGFGSLEAPQRVSRIQAHPHRWAPHKVDDPCQRGGPVPVAVLDCQAYACTFEIGGDLLQGGDDCLLAGVMRRRIRREAKYWRAQPFSDTQETAQMGCTDPAGTHLYADAQRACPAR